MKYLVSNHVRIFLAIVDAGSITKAADALDMGKSGVSDALKQLEASLGTQLLIRTTRRQSLTAMGEKFYRRCREMNDLSNAALEEVSEHLAEPMGLLRITGPHAMVECTIAPALGDLVARYPRIEPQLIVDDKRLDLIRDNIDLAITVGELPDSEFKAQRIGFARDILCASTSFCRDHGLDPEVGIAPEAVQGLPYVAHHWETSDAVHRVAARAGGTSKTFRFHKIATANSVNAVQALISNGAGIGILPHFFLRGRLETGELVELLPQYEPRSTGIYAIHPFGTVPPLSVRAMIDFMKQKLSEVA
ncbi:LysR family transcriptional regulator [uncultured Roseobacter sp.]|uniref:LysR family transcriptional regulator n=1 Tax=uncultured Roseobacter sp. TaxID=114847 RepID=UPI0026276195|nr:LysR family transcriptional regulator [uncultured Roseobacter sp.]